MSKKETKFTVLNKAIDKHGVTFQIEETPINPSLHKDIGESILAAIEKESPEDLKRVLAEKYIYSGDGNCRQGTNVRSNYEFTYVGDNHTRRLEYKYYFTRPMVEALLVEHSSLFRKIVTAVAASQNPKIHEVFVNSFKKTDIPDDIFLPWNQHEMVQRLSSLRSYSTKDSERAVYVSELWGELSKLSAEDKLPSCNNSFTVKVHWLSYKYRFYEILHSKDQHFIGHLGWKRVIANVATVIFSAGILNLINFAITNNFLFFNKTTTQEMISTLDKMLDEEQISGSNLSKEELEIPCNYPSLSSDDADLHYHDLRSTWAI